MPAPIDITDHTFGRLTAIKLAPKTGNSRYWICMCSCGKTVTVSLLHLRSGHTKSCGCLKSEKLPKGVSTFHALFAQYRRNAKVRYLPFTLTKEQFKKLVTSNCTYCGTPPASTWKSHYGRGDFIYNGLDRKDNADGYTLSNAAPCCKPCNFMKRQLGYDIFIEQVLRIARFQKQQV